METQGEMDTTSAKTTMLQEMIKDLKENLEEMKTQVRSLKTENDILKREARTTQVNADGELKMAQLEIQKLQNRVDAFSNDARNESNVVPNGAIDGDESQENIKRELELIK